MPHCQEKKVPHLERHQKHRKLKQLQTRAEKALFFVEQFGLKLEGITLHDEKGKHYDMEFPFSSTSTTIMPPLERAEAEHGDSSIPRPKSKYANLPEEEKKKVEEVLFLLDRFCINDEFYHKISMTGEGRILLRS